MINYELVTEYYKGTGGAGCVGAVGSGVACGGGVLLGSNFKLLSFSVPISEFQQRFDKKFCCYYIIIIMVLKVYK